MSEGDKVKSRATIDSDSDSDVSDSEFRNVAKRQKLDTSQVSWHHEYIAIHSMVNNHNCYRNHQGNPHHLLQVALLDQEMNGKMTIMMLGKGKSKFGL